MISRALEAHCGQLVHRSILLAWVRSELTSRRGAYRSTTGSPVGPVVFVTQCAETRRAENKVAPRRHVEAEPPRSENPQKMPARKQQHIAPDGAQPCDDAIGPRAHLVRRFASRATVAEQQPAGTFDVNFRGPPALILAVVPLDQVGIRLGGAAEAGQFAGSHGALQGAGENPGKLPPPQPLTERARVPLAALGEGRSARPVCGPKQSGRRRASPGDHWKRFAHALHSITEMATFPRTAPFT